MKPRQISLKTEALPHGWRIDYAIEADDTTHPGVRGVARLIRDGTTKNVVERLYSLMNGPSIRRDLRGLVVQGVGFGCENFEHLLCEGDHLCDLDVTFTTIQRDMLKMVFNAYSDGPILMNPQHVGGIGVAFALECLSRASSQLAPPEFNTCVNLLDDIKNAITQRKGENA